ncbi:DUF1573 domain-containing protein [Rosettibacter firmus]|uniref:DUF1573 domain-containing protein n=1 Tax=Rosettibacter firmus TaxID=3111522 RepID=UPI00336BF1D1
MKSKLLFLLAIPVLLGNIYAQPKAVFKPMSYDFGNIVQDSVVEKIFVITNEGNDTLKIHDIKVSCGCTAAVIGKKELAPSISTEIKVTFDSKGRLGKQNKIISVYTNDPDNSVIRLTLKGNVLKK